MARALYCSVDPALYYPEDQPQRWSLGYLGTFSEDRQPALNRLLLTPAAMSPRQRFVVAGPQYPRAIRWPGNVERISHLNPRRHRAFYNSQRYTLNITRAAMIQAGFSPSVRLFEAAACGTTIISDSWPGLETIFRPNEEILIVRRADEVLEILRELPPEIAGEIGAKARARVLEAHTSAHRALELERYIARVGGRKLGDESPAGRTAEPEMAL
jgi:spore maturation protein CgeB